MAPTGIGDLPRGQHAGTDGHTDLPGEAFISMGGGPKRRTATGSRTSCPCRTWGPDVPWHALALSPRLMGGPAAPLETTPINLSCVLPWAARSDASRSRDKYLSRTRYNGRRLKLLLNIHTFTYAEQKRLSAWHIRPCPPISRLPVGLVPEPTSGMTFNSSTSTGLGEK